MRTFRPLTLAMLSCGLLASSLTQAQPAAYFQRIAAFHVEANLGAQEPSKTGTAAEIIDFADNGNTLIYTDSPGQRLGFIDIRNPRQPRPAGTLAFGGEPTSVVVSGNLPKGEGKYSMYAAIIVKKVDAKTRSTTSLNDLLRD